MGGKTREAEGGGERALIRSLGVFSKPAITGWVSTKRSSDGACQEEAMDVRDATADLNCFSTAGGRSGKKTSEGLSECAPPEQQAGRARHHLPITVPKPGTMRISCSSVDSSEIGERCQI